MKPLRLFSLCLILFSSAARAADGAAVEEIVGKYLQAQDAQDFAAVVALMDTGELDEWKAIVLESVQIAADKGTLDLLRQTFEGLDSYDDYTTATSRDLYRSYAEAQVRYLPRQPGFRWQYLGYVSETDEIGHALTRQTNSYLGLFDMTHIVAVPIRMNAGTPLIGIGESGRSLARQVKLLVDPELMAAALRRSMAEQE